MWDSKFTFLAHSISWFCGVFLPVFSCFPLLPFSPPSSFYQFHRLITMSAASSSSSVAKTVSDKVFNATSSNSWSEFAKNVSGEWDGHGADFTKEGKPIELPEKVVPEAYKEWEVKVFDWQTQCPTLAQPDDKHLLFYKLIKLFPTVGCEADAPTRYSVDERNIGGGGVDNKVSASSFAYQSSGSYVAVWHMKDHLELEHCLVDPRNRESRVRVIQVVSAAADGGGGGGSKLALRNIKVFCEQWYGPYRNDEQLGGFTIRDSAFASTDALIGSKVTGVWQQAHISVARFSNSPHSELVEEDSMEKYVRDERRLILLPKQLWCSLKETENGETCSEVGWLLGEGHDAITSRCIFSSDAKLKEVAIARESAVLEGL